MFFNLSSYGEENNYIVVVCGVGYIYSRRLVNRDCGCCCNYYCWLVLGDYMEFFIFDNFFSFIKRRFLNFVEWSYIKIKG